MAELEARIVYGHAIEAFVALMEERRVAPQTVLAEFGIDAKRTMPRCVSIESYEQIVQKMAQHLHPELQSDDAVYQSGRDFMRHYARGVAGSVLIALGKAVGVRRSIERVAKSFRSANNFSEVAIVATGPTSMQLRMNHSFALHQWDRGLIVESLTMLGARDVVVALEEREALSVVFHVRWAA